MVKSNKKYMEYSECFLLSDSLSNYDSTLGENIKYLMHKYKFHMYQWYGSITPLINIII